MNLQYAEQLPQEWTYMSAVFMALGDIHRQKILLLFENDERLNAGQISDASPLSRSAVSHHLKILHQCNVLGSEKIGKEVWFWINKPLLEETFSNVLDYLNGK